MLLHDFRIAVALSLIHCVSDSESESDVEQQEAKLHVSALPPQYVRQSHAEHLPLAPNLT